MLPPTRDEALDELSIVALKRKETYRKGGKEYTALAVIWGFLHLLIRAIRQAPF